MVPTLWILPETRKGRNTLEACFTLTSKPCLAYKTTERQHSWIRMQIFLPNFGTVNPTIHRTVPTSQASPRWAAFPRSTTNMAPALMGITLLSQAFTDTDISCSIIIKTTVGVMVIWRAQGKHRSGTKALWGPPMKRQVWVCRFMWPARGQ